jgi:hypothetical protein
MRFPEPGDDRGKTASGNRDVVLLPDTPPSGRGEGGALDAVDDQTLHRGGEGWCVSGGDKEASHVWHNDFADAAAISRYYRQAARLRFEQRHAERLIDRGPYV